MGRHRTGDKAKSASARPLAVRMTLVDGPYTESKEMIGGSAIVGVKSPADAVPDTGPRVGPRLARPPQQEAVDLQRDPARWQLPGQGKDLGREPGDDGRLSSLQAPISSERDRRRGRRRKPPVQSRDAGARAPLERGLGR